MTEPRTLPAPAPVVSPETEPFWSAAADGRLLLTRCPSCQAIVWYPRALCPECGNPGTEWVEGSGGGAVYSFTINHKGEGAYKGAPYVLAYVELDEGPRMLTNIVQIAPDDVRIGMRVRAVFEPADDRTALVRFAPA